MFSGIIEELGQVQEVKKTSLKGELKIRAKRVLEGVKIGDSLSTNGVCLTLTMVKGNYFTADVTLETLAKTNLGELKPQERLNLESPLKFGEGMSGHFVTGHVDGVGQIITKNKLGSDMVLEIETPPEVAPYLVPKGSIAVDGISLTLAEVGGSRFKVVLISHTLVTTNLQFKSVGATLNLEADLIGKYVEKFSGADKTKTSKRFSLEQAFKDLT